MKPRRGTAVLAGTAALVLGGIPAAQAEVPAPQTIPDALYGEADPTYDGVWRQAATLLALDAAGQQPPAEAVDWLMAQQCEDGSFTAFRDEADEECGPATPSDTNATALAVQALDGVSGDIEADAAAAAANGVDWLVEVQNDDGGWPYVAGDATDTNSTALVVGALHAVGLAPDDVTSDEGATGYDALAALQLPCDGEDDAQAGAFAWQADEESGDLFANEAATVDAALAVHGSGLHVPTADGAGTPAMPACDELGDDAAPEIMADAVAAHLIGLLEVNDQHVPNSLADGAPDFGLTSRAVLALAAGDYPVPAEEPLAWLEENHTDWEGHDGDPAALAQLILAAHAVGNDPTDFGGTDLVAVLTALGPGGDGGDAATDTGDDAASDEATDDDGTSTGWLLWILGVGLLAGVGAGVLMSVRRRGTADGTSTAGGATGPGAGTTGGKTGGAQTGGAQTGTDRTES